MALFTNVNLMWSILTLFGQFDYIDTFVAVGLAILYAQILSAFDFFMSFSYSSLKISLPSSIGNSMVVILKSHVLHTLLRLTVGKP